MGEHLKLKKTLKGVPCPEAQFVIHKKELRAVVIQMHDVAKKQWWETSTPRFALATMVTIGIIAGIFVIGPLSPVSTSGVLANAEASHQQKGESGRFYYAKEKIVTNVAENESSLFLEMHEDVQNGDVYTRMYDGEGRMIDEHAIVAQDFFICVECIQEQIFSESSLGNLAYAGISNEEKPKNNLSERLYHKILSLQSNPSMASRSSLFTELKSNTSTSYKGRAHWKNTQVEEIDFVEQDNAIEYKTAFYFEKGTYDFLGSEEYILTGDEYTKIGSREILEESYSNQEFTFDAESLQKVVFE